MTTERTSSAAGRPRDAHLTDEILTHTIVALRAGGYVGVRIERIASAVGCGKPAIYRRWPTKAALVTAALERAGSPGALPDTGDVAEDLAIHVGQSVANYSAEYDSRAPSGECALWAVLVEPEVRDLMWEGALATRRQNGLRILERAIERGELPSGTDKNMVLDLLAGLTMYRWTVRDLPMAPAEYRAAISALVSSPPLAVADISSPAGAASVSSRSDQGAVVERAS